MISCRFWYAWEINWWLDLEDMKKEEFKKGLAWLRFEGKYVMVLKWLKVKNIWKRYSPDMNLSRNKYGDLDKRLKIKSGIKLKVILRNEFDDWGLSRKGYWRWIKSFEFDLPNLPLIYRAIICLVSVEIQIRLLIIASVQLIYVIKIAA